MSSCFVSETNKILFQHLPSVSIVPPLNSIEEFTLYQIALKTTRVQLGDSTSLKCPQQDDNTVGNPDNNGQEKTSGYCSSENVYWKRLSLCVGK